MKSKVHFMFTVEWRGYKSACWIWQRGKNQYGYGMKYVHPKKMLAHRWIYEMYEGLIAKGLDLDHLCRNPACVRPDHMEPVTHAVNIRRGSNAKMTHETVLELRKLKSEGYSNRALARLFGLNRSHVSRLYRGLKWRNP